GNIQADIGAHIGLLAHGTGLHDHTEHYAPTKPVGFPDGIDHRPFRTGHLYPHEIALHTIHLFCARNGRFTPRRAGGAAENRIDLTLPDPDELDGSRRVRVFDVDRRPRRISVVALS